MQTPKKCRQKLLGVFGGSELRLDFYGMQLFRISERDSKLRSSRSLIDPHEPAFVERYFFLFPFSGLLGLYPEWGSNMAWSRP